MARRSFWVLLLVASNACGLVTNLDDLHAPSHASDSGAVCTASGDDETVLADFATGFSSTQGSCGFSYGEYASSDPSSFELFSWDAANALWDDSPGSFLLIDGHTLSPTGYGMPALRWTSPYAGNVSFKGSVALPDPGQPIAGNGIVLRIFIAGEQVYTKQLSSHDSNPVDFECTEAIAAGLHVDFVIDPIDGNAYYDATRFVLTIHSVS